MTENSGYVIELAGKAAGLVVKEGKRYRFYASEYTFFSLERTVYQSPGEAEDACRRLLWPGRAPRPLTQLQKPTPFVPHTALAGSPRGFF